MSYYFRRAGLGPVTSVLTTLAVFGLGATRTPALARPRLAPELLARVAKGEVLKYLLATKAEPRLGKAIGIVEGSPEAIVHTLLDVANYQRYLPRVKGSRLIKRRGKTIVGLVEMRLPWPIPDASCTYRLTYKHLGGRVFELRWTRLRGSLRRYRGYALIEPWSRRADKAMLTYLTVFEPSGYAPDFVLAKAVLRAAEMFVHRARMRVKALVHAGKLPRDLRQRYK